MIYRIFHHTRRIFSLVWMRRNGVLIALALSVASPTIFPVQAESSPFHSHTGTCACLFEEICVIRRFSPKKSKDATSASSENAGDFEKAQRRFEKLVNTTLQELPIEFLSMSVWIKENGKLLGETEAPKRKNQDSIPYGLENDDFEAVLWMKRTHFPASPQEKTDSVTSSSLDKPANLLSIDIDTLVLKDVNLGKRFSGVNKNFSRFFVALWFGITELVLADPTIEHVQINGKHIVNRHLMEMLSTFGFHKKTFGEQLRENQDSLKTLLKQLANLSVYTIGTLAFNLYLISNNPQYAVEGMILLLSLEAATTVPVVRAKSKYWGSNWELHLTVRPNQK